MTETEMTETELRWTYAIRCWFDGHGGLLATAIRDKSLPLSDEARDFLSDLADGKVNKGKGGRPAERPGWVERSIVAEVFTHWEHLSKEAACAAVAERRGASEDEIRGVVDKVQKDGLTREQWIAWGRPDFKKN